MDDEATYAAEQAGALPQTWDANQLLAALDADVETDISEVPEEAVLAAIPLAESKPTPLYHALAALRHEANRRSVKRGEGAPEQPAALPPRIPILTNDPHRARMGDEDAAARIAEAVASTTAPLFYRDTVMLPSEISLQTAVEIEAFLLGHGKARLNAAEGTISYEVECADLWDACETAHEIVAELQSHGVEATVDRDNLLDVGAAVERLAETETEE